MLGALGATSLCSGIAPAAPAGSLSGSPFAPPRGTRIVSPLGWEAQPTHIWVFVVGLVHFQHHDVFDDFDPKNRRDSQLIGFFSARGVPDDHIVYLQDKAARRGAIGPALQKMLRTTAPGDTLFLYYEGHGYRSEDGKDGFFAAYDTDDDAVSGWPVNSICTAINRDFRGDRAFLTADCCDSGTLAQVVAQQRGRIAYAALASSSAREASTGNWTFTDCLLDAFRGAPYIDLDGNGVITLGELAAFTRAEMELAEQQHSTFARTANFSPDTLLSASRPRAKEPIGQRVRVKYGDDWLAGRVLATKPGEYLVKCIGYDDPPDWFDLADTTQMWPLAPPHTFRVGAPVEVKWHGKWYAAKVLKVEGGVHFIHYIEDDSSWDEWVPSSRIRAPKG